MLYLTDCHKYHFTHFYDSVFIMGKIEKTQLLATSILISLSMRVILVKEDTNDISISITHTHTYGTKSSTK